MDEEGQEIGGDRSRAVVGEILQPLNPTLPILKFLLHGDQLCFLLCKLPGLLVFKCYHCNFLNLVNSVRKHYPLGNGCEELCHKL